MENACYNKNLIFKSPINLFLIFYALRIAEKQIIIATTDTVNYERTTLKIIFTNDRIHISIILKTLYIHHTYTEGNIK